MVLVLLYFDNRYSGQSWIIRERQSKYLDSYSNFNAETTRLPYNLRTNPLLNTDTEILVTSRIKKNGWIYISKDHAFYFNSKN